MSRKATLMKLEGVLESFLERVVGLKESRLKVLDGINRLDDIAADFTTPGNLTEDMGEWFAQHNEWLSSDSLKPADRGRIEQILSGIKQELANSPGSPAKTKISSEIDRFASQPGRTRQTITLKRGPEVAGVKDNTGDTIIPFAGLMKNMEGLFSEVSRNRAHILSALDEALKKAELQLDKEALILSGLIIYYLKQNGYKVKPYVARLKKAELEQAGRS